MALDTAWIALIGTVFGGAGLKVVEGVMTRGSKSIDTATAMREELRKESQAVKEELRKVDQELDMWKEKYFALLQEFLELKSQVSGDDKDLKENAEKTLIPKENNW